jgi:DNA polymerase-3 subunit epsilon
VAECEAIFRGDARPGAEQLHTRLGELARQERFEDAATVRDRFLHLIRAAARAQRIAPLRAASELVAARRHPEGGWELACVRHGRLAGTAVSPRGADPMVYVATLRATAEVVPDDGRLAALPEETELVLRWLEQPDVRIVDLDGVWSCPVGGAGRIRHELEPAVAAASEVRGFDTDHLSTPRRGTALRRAG